MIWRLGVELIAWQRMGRCGGERSCMEAKITLSNRFGRVGNTICPTNWGLAGEFKIRRPAKKTPLYNYKKKQTSKFLIS